MIMDLDSIFLDEKFDDLTREVVKKKVEKVDPEVRKFQEIIDFINENGREPQRTKEWSNERALWARLRSFRDKPDREKKKKKYDTLDLLSKENEELLEGNPFDSVDVSSKGLDDILDDDLLGGDELDNLLDVSRYKKTINAASKIGRRKHASHFEEYKKLFEKVHAEIARGDRKIISFDNYDIQENRFYVQNGVMMYVVSIDDFYTDHKGDRNANMHVVYENGTENKNLLFRSLASSLYAKERHGRMVTDVVDTNTVAESFGMEYTTGYIYVLQSLSNNPAISGMKNLYKIGFTSGEVSDRIANASNEVTYLNAPVHVVLSAQIQNVSAQKIERTLHHAFSDKQVVFQDGDFVKANEWFIVPLEEIENKINEIVAGLQK